MVINIDEFCLLPTVQIKHNNIISTRKVFKQHISNNQNNIIHHNTYIHTYAPNQHHWLIHNEMTYDKQMLAAEFNKIYHLLTGIHKLLQILLSHSSITIMHITIS